MAADESYAPKSPDLSSFYSPGPTQPASQIAPYPDADAAAPLPALPAPFSPSLPSSALQGRVRDGYSPVAYRSISAYPPPSPIKSEGRSYSSSSAQPYLPPGSSPSRSVTFGLQSPTQHHQQQHFRHRPTNPPLPLPPYFQPQPQPLPLPGQHARPPALPTASDPDPADMPPRRAVDVPPPPVAEPSPVKTKFPTARIKRIMQADEEVGKVAQQTPIAVGKALELFMIQLVTKSADVAKEKGSKRVTAPMLKHVVETDDQWDFLRDIVSRVDNEKEGSRAKAKTESESDDDFVEPRKRGRGGGRRKKA
ncbi:hypothetical protein XA68_18389 [Ophiocordyceps unilateralis]|uniref:NCT transcriptional regulatory complex subunit A n=1 Tax=Ophiocordyceps unilateralis TaxID=268505 RepID=A0A2A9PII4_OPHUN|nr:hypothetical protein XA68_18389 [Ophiocordyceps unilateralis]